MKAIEKPLHRLSVPLEFRNSRCKAYRFLDKPSRQIVVRGVLRLRLPFLAFQPHGWSIQVKMATLDFANDSLESALVSHSFS